MKIKLFKFLLVLLAPFIFWAQNSQRNLSSEAWSFGKKTDANWLPATVPGTIHTDLFRSKVIPDPFIGSNEKQLQWIENEDWQYQATFNISADEFARKNCFLQFDGLDTFAKVTLNGSIILSANNMFRSWKVGVKHLLKIGENKLEITFASAVKYGKNKAASLKYILPGDEKVFVRKAQYHFGWDWGPRFVTAGIWKNVSLNFWNDAFIMNLKCNQKSIFGSTAELEFTAEIQSAIAGTFALRVNDKTQDVTLKKGRNSVSVNYEISNPKLWWPNGLGEPYLYPFDVNLMQHNQIIDSKKLDIGLRTIELIQEEDSKGKNFYFKVNGKSVFMKGANVIPPDSFLPQATDSVYQSIVQNAKNSNMNMLRVWGGGVYGDDAFYDACDRNGILVWQDFMFACAMYPGSELFLKNVKEEIKDNVSRLRNHPSIALWCGNNESDEGWHNWGWQKQYHYTKADSTKIWTDYKKLFHELIPQTLSEILPQNENRYWPSSPSVGWGRKESLTRGDSHYWGVWWGKEPFATYEKKIGRFMSEYGFQGMPNLETFQSFANTEELNLQSEAVKNHQKHPTGYQTINEYMARDYKIPSRFEDYSYVSQLLQASGMKTAIEAHRRAKPYCMGSLFWQLNDCWPVTSWSSVDYYGRWKALHYQVRKSFENLAISVAEEQDGYAVFIINDDLNPYKGKIILQMMDFNGRIYWSKAQATEEIPANASRIVATIEKETKDDGLSHKVLSVKFESEAKSTATLFYFVSPKDLELARPSIQIKKIDDLTYEVSSDVLAKNVYLSSDQETFFSDNYFDLLPTQPIEIKLSKPVQKIEAKSLFDTLN